MNNTKIEEDNVEFTTREFINEVLCHKFLIIGIVLACMLLSYLYTSIFVDTTYTSKATLHLLDAETVGTSTTELSTFSYLANDFVELIPTKSMIEKSYDSVKDKLSQQYTVNMIKSSLTVEKRENTRIIDISVTLQNEQDTKILADAIAETSCKSFIDSYKKDIIEIADRQGPGASKSRIKDSLLIGFVAGIIISLLLLLIMKTFNDKLSGTEDVEKYLGLGTLATIPYNRGNQTKKSDTRKANEK